VHHEQEQQAPFPDLEKEKAGGTGVWSAASHHQEAD